MKRIVSTLCFCLCLVYAQAAFAHFGMIIPDKSIVPKGEKEVELTLSFAHPFEGHGMNLVKPKKFEVFYDGKAQDILSTLKEEKVMDHQAWEADYKVKRPGMYIFVMEPQPYPEPAEDNYIIHYTKTYVCAYDEGEGWNEPLGLKTEIIPLTRPWGNYAGNVFEGVVLLDGKPVSGCTVEVEYYNKDGKAKAPSDCMVTQEVLTDVNGVFTFACPEAGWWGFAALNSADYKIDGKEVELGAVLWTEMKKWEDWGSTA